MLAEGREKYALSAGFIDYYDGLFQLQVGRSDDFLSNVCV